MKLFNTPIEHNNQYTKIGNCTLYNADCFDIFPSIPDNSIDAIICDLPYGTTACKWDSILPMDKLWAEYKRIIKPTGNILLFSDEPFTSVLITSNLSQFKQRITWDKQTTSGYLLSKKMLLRTTEDICLFTPSKLGNQTYNPITFDRPKHKVKNHNNDNRNPYKGGLYREHKNTLSESYSNHKELPTNLWSVNSKNAECNALHRVHPTQKPVELIKMLLLTYTNDGDTVLDNTMGSGTTGVACMLNNRAFIGIEKEREYFDIAVKRISE